VKEAVLLVPQLILMNADPVHSCSDPKEVLRELRCYVLVTWIMLGKLQVNLQQVLGKKTHPGCAVGLFQRTAGRQRRATVEDANVVQSQEAALENVVAFLILPVYPPGEIQQQLSERLFQVPHILAS